MILIPLRKLWTIKGFLNLNENVLHKQEKDQHQIQQQHQIH
uniref:Uncharacterized protein n=1 Tax=Meloidogyne enterolobii TaxID=390850 RepID=A0A6V7UEM9_MELEN|nr:unnamed protein product [Meloidogyne enterolobii]